MTEAPRTTVFGASIFLRGRVGGVGVVGFVGILDSLGMAQWKFSGDKHKFLQVCTERIFHQLYPLVLL